VRDPSFFKRKLETANPAILDRGRAK